MGYTLRNLLADFLRAPERARSQAEETARRATQAAEWITRNVTADAMLGVEADFGYYSEAVRLTAKTPSDARKIMKFFGGKWDKQFNEMTGKIDMKRSTKIDNKGVTIVVEPSKTCKVKVEEVTRTSTYTEKRYIPQGNCGSVLDELKD